MEKKTANFLKISFISIPILCIAVFAALATYMSGQTQKSITEVSEIYMSEMNLQLQQKFSSIIDLRLVQVEGIIKRDPPDNAVYDDTLVESLETSAEVRNFSSLSFLTADGQLENVCGETVQIGNDDRDDAMAALEEGGYLVTKGRDAEGNPYLLLGERAAYPMEDGGKSEALVAAVPMDYLSGALYLQSDDAMVYSHIIDSDGSYVIRTIGASGDNYFDGVKGSFDEGYGEEADRYVSGLQQAIRQGTDYSTFITIEREQRQVYCSPLSKNTSWYLVTVMPNSILRDAITDLASTRWSAIFTSSLILLLAMCIVFFLYFRLSRKQMTELNEAKQKLVRANMAKSDFLPSMSHDIRTPMNAIVGMTEIALKNTHDADRVEDCLNKVKLSSKHLLGLINDVLDMSKIESGKMTLRADQMSLRESMDDIVNIIRPQIKSRNQYFDIFIEKIIAENVYCDSVRLNQVLLNLLSNAMKFTPEQGRIDVHLYQEESPRGDEYVRTHLWVNDTGIGMSEEFQAKIFDSFEREDSAQVQQIAGTGLGMSIVKHIVELMGGTIELQSELEKGSKFHVTLDLKKVKAEDQDMTLPPWNILVVDDNEQLCLSAASNLEELGVHADWALDGKSAVEMVEKRHNQHSDYQFVLVDWKMPDMSGLDTIREIRNRVKKEIPVFLISAYDWDEIENEAHAADIEGFIPKPLFKSTLHSCLREYAEEGTAHAEPAAEQNFDFTGKKALLAEDVDINWEIANAILGATGLQIDRVLNGQECVEKFQQSDPGYYDLILMDIRMPVMNGYDATKTIRALEDRPDRDLPIIAMTADAFSDDAQRCLESGMNAHLTKPLDIKDCMRVLHRYLQ